MITSIICFNAVPRFYLDRKVDVIDATKKNQNQKSGSAIPLSLVYKYFDKAE